MSSGQPSLRPAGTGSGDVSASFADPTVTASTAPSGAVQAASSVQSASPHGASSSSAESAITSSELLVQPAGWRSHPTFQRSPLQEGSSGVQSVPQLTASPAVVATAPHTTSRPQAFAPGLSMPPDVSLFAQMMCRLHGVGSIDDDDGSPANLRAGSTAPRALRNPAPWVRWS